MQSTKGSIDDRVAAAPDATFNRQVHNPPENPGRHRFSTSSRRSLGGLKPRSGDWGDPEKLASAMRTMGQQQHSQRETCTGALQAKLDELQELNSRMEGLCSSAKELLEGFGSEDTRFRTEFRSQLESLERFKGERMSIDAMRERLRVEQGKVEDFERRIERVQSKVERQKEKEAGKKRVSWRVRFLWGFLAMLVILWLLATAGSDGDYMLDNLTESQPIKLVSPSLKNGHDLEEFPLE